MVHLTGVPPHIRALAKNAYSRRPEQPAPAKPPSWTTNRQELYDVLAERTMEAPIQCVDWLPWSTPLGSEAGRSCRLLLGTDASREFETSMVTKGVRAAVNWQERDFLHVLRVDVRHAPSEQEAVSISVEVEKSINHPGAVCCVSHSPWNPDFAATGSVLRVAEEVGAGAQLNKTWIDIVWQTTIFRGDGQIRLCFPD
eukprot:TRINITY_DN23182_c0_g1_i2.p2 TRINITY_DN23182_c0_g1~~TRINITY_DN23182_c0_g1_i2.p2  ORF type:complete len:198 (-),score=9.94 TRINITY_DN23182_c0_g1_i2:148-741(-)